MTSDAPDGLIPRETVRHLIGALDDMKTRFLEATEQWQLLDETGHVPATPSYTGLLQHAADAQALSRDVARTTNEFATAHSTHRAGSTVLTHLATAATMSCHAAAHFAETAEAVLALPRLSDPTSRRHWDNRMVLDHASARAYLRRTAESLGDAATQLREHLDIHHALPTPSRHQSPAPPPPGPNGRNW